MNGMAISVDQPMAEAETAVRQALAEVDFGVLTEIDVAGTLPAKLGVSGPPLKALGTCRPSFAHRALELDPSLVLLMPCNVVLEEVGDGRTRVTIADPRALLGAGHDGIPAGLQALGDEAAAALEEAAAKLRS